MAGQSQTRPQVCTVTSFLVDLTWLTLTTALWLRARDLGYNFCFLSWHPNTNLAFQTEVRSAWPCRWLLCHTPPSELLQTPPTSASSKSHPQVGSARGPNRLTCWGSTEKVAQSHTGEHERWKRARSS